MIIALEMQPPTQPPMHCGKDLKASYLGCLSFPACKASCIGVDRVRAWKFKVEGAHSAGSSQGFAV